MTKYLVHLCFKDPEQPHQGWVEPQHQPEFLCQAWYGWVFELTSILPLIWTGFLFANIFFLTCVGLSFLFLCSRWLLRYLFLVALFSWVKHIPVSGWSLPLRLGRYAITIIYTPSIYLCRRHAPSWIICILPAWRRHHGHDLLHLTSLASPSCSSSPTPSTASMASKLEEHNLLLLLASFLTTGDYHNVLVDSGQWSMLSLFDNILFPS